MKYQIAIICLGVCLIATLTVLDKYKHGSTEILKVERTQDSSEGEFSLILKDQAHYELTQRQLDSLLISLATDTIR